MCHKLQNRLNRNVYQLTAVNVSSKFIGLARSHAASQSRWIRWTMLSFTFAVSHQHCATVRSRSLAIWQRTKVGVSIFKSISLRRRQSAWPNARCRPVIRTKVNYCANPRWTWRSLFRSFRMVERNWSGNKASFIHSFIHSFCPEYTKATIAVNKQ